MSRYGSSGGGRNTYYASYIQLPAQFPAGKTSSETFSNYSYSPFKSFCTNGNTSKWCTGYMDENSPGASTDVCGRTNNSGDQKPTCCKTGCGQVENMATCAIVYKDNCNKNLNNCGVGGRLVCTHSCRSRCSKSITSAVDPVSNFTKYPTVFQQRNFGSGGSGHNDCNDGDSLASGVTPWQTCVYSVGDFEHIGSNDMNSLLVGKEGNPNYDEIMSAWCAQTESSGCPVDSFAGTTPSSCVRLRSNTSNGKLCQSWLSGLQKNNFYDRSQGYLDAIASSYCSRYPTAGECRCVNRSRDPTYRLLKPSFPYNDGCWYNPCVPTYEPDYYFVPSDVQVSWRTANDQGTQSMCPTNFCGNFINAKNGNVTLENSTEYTQCGGAGSSSSE